MDLKEYFENKRGLGVLSTADSEGKVDSALYARPHFMDDGTVSFIMRDRLTHANLQSNPHASYLFVENMGKGYKGVRLFLEKSGEEQDTEKAQSLRRKQYDETDEQRGPLFLVHFKVAKLLPLVGDGVVEALQA